MLGFGPPNRFPLGENFRGGGLTGSLAVTLDAVTLSSASTLALKGTASITLDAVSLSAASTIALKGAAAITLADVTLSSAAVIPLKAAAAITLDSILLNFTGAIAIKGAAAILLDDVTTGLAGEFGATITDTEVLQLPIDCVLAGQQHYKQSGREYEIGPKWTVEKAVGKTTRPRRLSRAKPSFTVKTGTRGYD